MPRVNVYTYSSEITAGLSPDPDRIYSGYFRTESAEEIEGKTEFSGQTHVSRHPLPPSTYQSLYRTAGERWVLATYTGWQGSQTRYEFISDERAKQWLIINESDDIIARFFGPQPEEAGPGRPEIGPPIQIRLGEDLTARLDARRRDGESRAAVVRRLLTDALTTEIRTDYPAPGQHMIIRKS